MSCHHCSCRLDSVTHHDECAVGIVESEESIATVSALLTDRDTLRSENARLREALSLMLKEHDGTHAESCNAYGHGKDADLPAEPSDADPHCDCGIVQSRNRARAALQPAEEKT